MVRLRVGILRTERSWPRLDSGIATKHQGYDSKRRVMGDYEQGKRDCELGVPHHNKSEAYTQGYSEQYAKEQCNAAQ